MSLSHGLANIWRGDGGPLDPRGLRTRGLSARQPERGFVSESHAREWTVLKLETLQGYIPLPTHTLYHFYNLFLITLEPPIIPSLFREIRKGKEPINMWGGGESMGEPAWEWF